MFTTACNLTNLASADIIYGDGTFYTSTTQFTQLYTLHAMVYDVMYPLVFGLLPGKSEEIYDRYINLLKTTCQQHQPQLTPDQPQLTPDILHRLQDIWRKTQNLDSPSPTETTTTFDYS